MTDLVTAAKTAARDALNDLEAPQADIPPLLVAKTPKGYLSVQLEMPQEPDQRDMVADYMMALIACSRATEAVFICTAWMATATLADMRRPSEREDKNEVLVLAHDNGDTTSLWMAGLTRHENRPPDMGLWKHDEESTMGGRFAEALSLGLKLSETVAQIPGLQDQLDEAATPEEISSLALVLVETLQKARNA
jgi:hypothetical protein